MAKRAAPEVNAGSMADIAFLLLIFFLVTTTIETNQGLSARLPERQPVTEDAPPLRKRNVFEVMVNQNDQLLVENELMEIGDLREAAVAFLDNGGDGSCAYCQGTKDVNSSVNPNKAIISLRNQRGTSYKMYVAVQNELQAAYNVLRERERERLYPNEVSWTEMWAQYNAAKTSDARKDALKPKIEKLQELFPYKLSEAEPKKD
ncbi:biopolymer transporter ExbD [Neptunitalea chrysea]|uniref:Biopolymer transporter ExbD n=1 Tax=Neptunitalea chrysea TaxID=1647581 RepID=A0A9W6B445_9FLAO|nr:biopolymer transporter ExbD [Neptunitalea chrysea]GLB50967.1 biopolymer transporter ExbD [Neptunitalea chrysea]